MTLTFDVDGKAALIAESDTYASRLSSLSDQQFGVTRGLPRIRALLRGHGLAATFYVPGKTAATNAHAIRELFDEGHEIGHHGHRHLPVHRLPAEEQRVEIEKGCEALERVVGARPRGYRAPAWEVTPETFRFVSDAGFSYDSSFMGDDRPYLEEHDGRAILEFPVHWVLDDFPFFAFRPSFVGPLARPSDVLDLWLAEVDSAARDGRHVTFTMHPEVIGRGSRFPMLQSFVERLMARGDIWIARHEDVAMRVSAPRK